jgi:NADPH:quinone reductase-like Zn-dependent oxidoreductase
LPKLCNGTQLQNENQQKINAMSTTTNLAALQTRDSAMKPAGSATTQTMKAIRIHNYGGPEVLRYEDAPRPEPGAGEILIRIHAAGVNPIDWKIRDGYMKEALPNSLPLIPGWDVSGVVEKTGPEVSRLKEGDEVYGVTDITRDGSYAEYMVALESELALKPKSLHHAHAAGVPIGALTAWQALFDVGELRPGERVLIHAGAGGVGHLAIQLAKLKGAQVFATASTRNQELLRELGADEPIDYTTQRFEDVAGDVDVVLDTVGGETQERSCKTLKKGGILVSLTEPPSAEKAAAHGVRATFHAGHPRADQLAEIAALIDSGEIKVLIDRIIPLSEARRAQELSQSGRARGKIVLRVKDAV